VQRGGGRTDVARRADGDVQLAVGTEGDELPAVVAVGRKVVAGHFGLRRAGQIAGDVGEFQDAIHHGDVERPVPEGHAARLAQPAGQDVHGIGLAVAVAIDDRIDLALGARADEDDAGWAERHLPGVGDVRRVDGDAESRGQGDVADLGGRARQEAGEVTPIVAADDDHRRHHHQDEQRQNEVGAAHGRDGGATRLTPGRPTRS
jgi:hypothetical protein